MPAPPFEAKKGLRQGDPMSPFLFAIVMEYLSRCLYELSLNPDLNFHPRCEKLCLTHMMFADDLLMFSRADSESVKLLFHAFYKFSKASGLSANLDKNEVYFGGVFVDIQTELRDLLGSLRALFPSSILVCPFPLRSLLFLSAQIFILPKKIMKEIEARFRCFLCTGSSAPARKSLSVRNSVCLPKVYGGWNLISLPKWNKAAITKLLWDIAHKADNLWRCGE
ncbi:uncharacterized protein LOC110730428 [Chenopodium quinoa]|uniref:uncharacterized protein LOC110730428 n=1 Tax=Chenopodium quinoa TaxID=63459 RepID=UPI000B7912CC|nr:uncharacterized protein LOC110730428 [Chenopodium quinoa]